MTEPHPGYYAMRLAALRGPLRMELETGPEPAEEFASALRRIAEQLAAAAAPRLLLEVRAGGDRPSLRVCNVRYLALPLGAELAPFLDLLLQLDRSAPRGTEPPRARLLLLTAPACPVCPAAVSVCNQLAALSPWLELTIVDAQQFPELAAGCRSVPTLIIDRRRALIGPISLDELHALLARGDQPDRLQADLASLVQAGRLADAGRLLHEPEGGAAFAALFAAAPLPERVGLLLLAEEVLAEEPTLLDSALPHLVRVQGSSDPSRRGDLADLLGRIGSPAARRALQAMLEDEHPEVRAAAREALASQAAPN